ncbi:hypothetical protein EWM64_g8803 [Hericium alpestre]|uniref:RING-type domain-containing protein n=1 Tax=Hericium alpestre TaxID=135208 RepID=A0A4Y9ZP45_9AGAM|nr:hypothetical protein EWM64_g8803 [Hericium alpestre]
MPSDPDVIIISSDEEDTPPKVRRARKGKAKARRLGPTPSKEIIEISSVEGRGRGESSTDKIQKELARYREKIAKYEMEIERAREEAMNCTTIAELAKREAQNSKKDAEKLKVDLAMEKAKARAGSSSTSVSPHLQRDSAGLLTRAQTVPTELLDNVSTCEICQDRMWKPATLTDCGHTFCQHCLTDWFSTTLAQHMTAHPLYNPNTAPPPLDPALLTHLPAQLHPYLLKQALHRRCTRKEVLTFPIDMAENIIGFDQGLILSEGEIHQQQGESLLAMPVGEIEVVQGTFDEVTFDEVALDEGVVDEADLDIDESSDGGDTEEMDWNDDDAEDTLGGDSSFWA